MQHTRRRLSTVFNRASQARFLTSWRMTSACESSDLPSRVPGKKVTIQLVVSQAATRGFEEASLSVGFGCGLAGANTRMATRIVASVPMYATACMMDGRSS